MTYGHDGSQVLFRQAKAPSAAARRFQQQADEQQAAGSSGAERRQREKDAVITTLILVQAAAEGHASPVRIQAGIPDAAHTRFAEIFRWAQRLTAIQAPFPGHAWLACGEC